MSSSNRTSYLNASSLTQTLLNSCSDNLECRLELIVDIQLPTGFLRASDRNKYVGGVFYEALLNFPAINRTLGEWLAPQLELSQLSLEFNNSDGRLGRFLPGGDEFSSMVGNTVLVRLGLGENESTYFPIFSGFVTEEAGVARTTRSVRIVARDRFDRLNQTFPKTVFSPLSYPDISDSEASAYVPIIFGDYTTALDPEKAAIPATVVNSKSALLPALGPVQLVISENDLAFFDPNNVWLFRSDAWWQAPGGQITPTGSGNKSFFISQNSATWVDGGPFIFDENDKFYVRVRGQSLPGGSDNPVQIARQILKDFAGLTDSDFSANWTTFASKPIIAATKCRITVLEPISAIESALSILEQVRLEAYIDRDLKIKLSSLHFDDFNPSPTFIVKNFDVAKDSFNPGLDSRNNFNKAQAVFSTLPKNNETSKSTLIYKNQASIDMVGKSIGKQLSFPNLYIDSDVITNTQEILKLASAMVETITVDLTWRALLLDVGDFVLFNIDIGSTNFEMIPALIREISYNPQGLTITLKCWSFQLCPYPGYSPGYAGTVGGAGAIITVDS